MQIQVLTKRQTDWKKKKCCLCQKDNTNEALVSPSIHNVLQLDGYVMLATNVSLFHELDEMPMIFDLAMLNEDGGVEATLRRN